jgi:phosphohistidine swiveling domain-containing protein
VSRWIRRSGTSLEIGGKAGGLAALGASGLAIPEWFAVRAPNGDEVASELPAALTEELLQAVGGLADPNGLLAVRSSAVEEDGVEHSFAGQFESFLYVTPGDVPERVRDVWRTAASARVDAYRRERGIAGPARLPAVVVQRMIDPDVAGVAFSADPVSGQRGVCVVSAAYGVGSGLVSGDAEADTYRVARDGTIIDRRIVAKQTAQRRGPAGPVTVAVPNDVAVRPALDDAQIRTVAAMARAAEQHFGRPQDIEWAMAGGRLFLLQSRPITSLASMRDPDGVLALWDNSNITESYGGITTPLTYSFARYVYEHVYRQFCRIVGVSARRIDEHEDAFRAMLGLIRGRVYYNLVSWYRILALLPGYRLNRTLMEQMMGVKEGLPAELEATIAMPTWRTQLADGFALTRTVGGLVVAHWNLTSSIAAFRDRLDRALAARGDLTLLRADELVAHYRELERQLLTRWDAPLVNDFFAMIFHGVLRKLVASWCGDSAGTLHNDLVSGGGEIVSAEPAVRISRMATIAATDRSLVDALCNGDLASARAAVAAHADLSREVESYLATFGDRCLEELKLETMTLLDDPLMLLRSIGRLASARKGVVADVAPRPDFRGEAEHVAQQALSGHPIRRAIFGWVLRHARARVRDRENLRFERTRVFGRVRRIFVELGKRYAAVGAVDDPRDVFYLTVEESLGWAVGTAAGADLRALAAARRAEFARYHEQAAPADRFETRGLVYVGHDFRPPIRATADAPAPLARSEGEVRQGTGCYPGVVRGVVRVVRDPRAAILEPGEILVAERTDPGWVMLFPGARGLLVERGSLLSHSAIVARELGLPAIIAVEGLTAWLSTGDEVEFDGRSGEIRRLTRAAHAA